MTHSNLNRTSIVVGGGMAGLTAAVFLARQNQKVIVLERSQHPGGLAQTQTKHGFSFNIGPHAVGLGGAAFRILTELGIPLNGGVPAYAGSVALFRDRVFQLPTSPVSMFTTGMLSLAEKFEAIRFLAGLEHINTEQLLETSIQTWVDQHLKHATMREYLKALLRLSTYSNAPEQTSAGVALAQMKQGVKHNVLYLHNGWQSMVNSLCEMATQAGVEIRTSAPVQSVIRDEQGMVQGVQLVNGERLPAAAVILAVPPKVALDLVEGSHQSAFGRWAAQTTPIKLACLDLALSRVPRPTTNFALGIDQPWYFSVHSAAAKLGPAGGGLIHVAKYLPVNASDSSASVRAELEHVLDLVQPGWREVIVHQRFLPEMTVANSNPKPVASGLGDRPQTAVSEIPGLFLAGDWVGPEGLLVDASVASARDAARKATEFISKDHLSFPTLEKVSSRS